MDQRISQEECNEGRPSFSLDDGTLFVYSGVDGVYQPYNKSDKTHNAAAEAKNYAKSIPLIQIKRDIPAFLLSIATLVGVGFYTYYAARQTCAAISQLTLSTDTMRLDERAWVSVLNVKPPDKGEIGAKVVFQNTGKTPATEFYVEAIANPDQKAIEIRTQGVGVISPIGEFTSYVRPERKFPLSAEIFYHGTAHYVSVFGHQHWTKFCYHRPINAPGFVPCDNGNEIDQLAP